MQKFFYILLFISTLSNQIFTEQAYGLKDSYDIRVNLQGSDKISINKGMQEALKTLFVKVSGSSEILEGLNDNNLLKNPQNYISEYRLENNEEGKLQGNFLFSGRLIRQAVIKKSLPLWTGKISTVLVYLPCLTETASSLNENITSNISCLNSKQEIQNIAATRLSYPVFPSMDLIDLSSLDMLRLLPANVFMSKISKRYDLSDWLACFNKDDFGIVIEKPYCISSINTNANSLQKTFNELINFINNEFQVQVNNDLQITVPVIVRNVRGQEALNEVLANISNNILVKNLNLKTIQNNDIQLSVQVLGSKIDFRKIMIANEEFDHSPDDEDRIALSFIYKKRI